MSIFNKEDEKKGKENRSAANRMSSSMLQSIKGLDDEIKNLRKRKGLIEKSFDKTFSDLDKDKAEKAKLRKKIQEFSNDEGKIRVKRKVLVEEMKKISEQESKVAKFKRKMSEL